MAPADATRRRESHLMGELEQAAALLFREARHLDSHEWEAWVAMYREDAVYWLPAWRDEYETTSDPQTEVSLIYHNARLGLEERIARIESRKSITALPLPRTLHQIGNVELRASSPDHVETEATFAVHVYDPRTAKEHTRFGRYQHVLSKEADRWRIAKKKIILVNDKVPTVLDFYSI
jgi:benzoate/toluate 1,2-dioxygenase beta subunit/2,4,5-trichlorophenoxyacetic acid oxygenase 2